MSLLIRPYTKADFARVLEICIAAFEPIHQSFEQARGRRIFERQYHDWREQYAETLRKISKRDAGRRVHVAETDGVVAGFIFTFVDAKRKTGEIGLNAVDPALQGRGIGRAMYEFALKDLKARGAEIACVGTGGDDFACAGTRRLCVRRLRLSSRCFRRARGPALPLWESTRAVFRSATALLFERVGAR